jgi:hypothetical protein
MDRIPSPFETTYLKQKFKKGVEPPLLGDLYGSQVFQVCFIVFFVSNIFPFRL